MRDGGSVAQLHAAGRRLLASEPGARLPSRGVVPDLGSTHRTIVRCNTKLQRDSNNIPLNQRQQCSLTQLKGLRRPDSRALCSKDFAGARAAEPYARLA